MKIFILALLIFIPFCKKSEVIETRTFYMAAAPFQFILHAYSAESDFVFDGFKGNIDIVSLHTDNFFGIPWEEFSKTPDTGGAWFKKMMSLKAETEKLGVDIYLSLTPLSGFRNGIASKAIDDNGVLKNDNLWNTGCYNFDSGKSAKKFRTAYLRYVRWMVELFKPKFLTHGIEINMYASSCPDCYESLIRLLNDVYNQEKKINPELIIFPTFTMNDLWGYGSNDGSAGSRATLIKNLDKQKNILRDRFGISAYPLFLQWEFSKLPDDYFSAINEITGEIVVFGETGQGNHNVTIPWPELKDPCRTILNSSDNAQKDYMEFVFKNARALGSDLVVWWSLRDYLPKAVLENCPCNAPGIWCSIYNEIYKSGLLGAWMMWGSMGVLDYDLNKKPVYETWKKWIGKKITN